MTRVHTSFANINVKYKKTSNPNMQHRAQSTTHTLYCSAPKNPCGHVHTWKNDSLLFWITAVRHFSVAISVCGCHQCSCTDQLFPSRHARIPRLHAEHHKFGGTPQLHHMGSHPSSLPPRSQPSSRPASTHITDLQIRPPEFEAVSRSSTLVRASRHLRSKGRQARIGDLLSLLNNVLEQGRRLSDIA